MTNETCANCGHAKWKHAQRRNSFHQDFKVEECEAHLSAKMICLCKKFKPQNQSQETDVTHGSSLKRGVRIPSPDTRKGSQSTPDKMSRNLPASTQPQVKVAESGGHIFDMGYYGEFDEKTLKERQRLKAEVEKILNSMNPVHSDQENYVKELKKRLFSG